MNTRSHYWSLFCLFASIDTTLWITISLALITSFELSPEQTRMKSKFFLLSAWSSITDRCDFRHNQLSMVRFSFIFVRRTLFENTFLNFVYLNSAWEVAMVVSSQLKTMKPHLWHIQVIPYAHRIFFVKRKYGGRNCDWLLSFRARWVNMVSFKHCMK